MTNSAAPAPAGGGAKAVEETVEEPWKRPPRRRQRMGGIHHAHYHRQGGSQPEMRAGDESRPSRGAGRHLEHGGGAAATRGTPRAERLAHRDNDALRVDEHHVDGEARAEGVDRRAWTKQQASSAAVRASERPRARCREAAGDKGRACSQPMVMNFTAIGNQAMKVQGKMQAISGSSIFTGASIAAFSARAKRSARRCSPCARNVGPRLMPMFSA